LKRKSLLFKKLWARLKIEIDILVLRNYEGFPDDLGNDIDCLVPADSRAHILQICSEVSEQINFSIFKIETPSMNLITVFFNDNLHSDDLLKLDFFSGQSKAWVSFARTGDVLNNKIEYGDYYVPELTDEAYLLLMKELFMYGRLRDRYIERFSNKYQKIDFEKVYALSSGLISKNSIKLIEDNYSSICQLRLFPRPTLRNLCRPVTTIVWLVHRIGYLLKK
jgi:hypothetical protein